MENYLTEVDPGPVGELIEHWLSIAGLPEEYAILLRTVAIVVLIIFAAWFSNFVTRRLLLVYISRWIKRSKSMWDDILLEHKLLDRLANYAPALIIYYAVPAALSNYPDIVRPVQVMISLTMIMLAILVIDALLNALHEIYQTFPISRDVNIKGYIQIVKILTYFVGIILFLSVVMEKSPHCIPDRTGCNCGCFAACLQGYHSRFCCQYTTICK
jgi:miniconductance mechanosensitive channel